MRCTKIPAFPTLYTSKEASKASQKDARTGHEIAIFESSVELNSTLNADLINSLGALFHH